MATSVVPIIPSKVIFSPLNDWVVTLYGLQDVITLAYVNGATTTLTLYDTLGNPVPGASNISMAYLPATTGNYQGSIPFASFNPPIGTGYSCVITADAGGFQYQLTLPCEIDVRTK